VEYVGDAQERQQEEKTLQRFPVEKIPAVTSLEQCEMAWCFTNRVVSVLPITKCFNQFSVLHQWFSTFASWLLKK